MVVHGHDRTGDAAAWLRRADIAVHAFLYVSALAGLGFVLYAASAGEGLAALGGGLVTLAGVIVGLIGLTLVRCGVALLARTDRIEHLLLTLEAMESTRASHDELVNIARGAGGNAESLVAANVPADGFPRLAGVDLPEGPGEAPEPATAHTHGCSDQERQWQRAIEAGDVIGCRKALATLRAVLVPERVASLEQALATLSRTQAVQLREDFAERVRSQDYAGALTTGDRLATLFPDSGLARDFEAVRPRLVECSARQPPAVPVSRQ